MTSLPETTSRRNSKEDKTPPDIFYRCHPKDPLKTVICIICDGGFHKSDFERKIKNGAVYLTKTLVICDEHKDLTLEDNTNSDTNNSENLRKTIAYLRVKCLKLGELCKDYKKREVNISKPMNTEDKNENKNKDGDINRIDIDKAVLMEKTRGLEELNKSLTDQNITLKELNAELKTTNMLQKKLLQGQEKQMDNTYAKAVQGNSKYLNKTKDADPTIIINNLDKKNSHGLATEIKNVLTTQTAIPNQLTLTKSKDKIIIKCNTQENLKQIHNLVQNISKQRYEVNIEKKRDPLLKVVGIETETTDYDEIKQDIVKRNSIEDGQQVQVNYIYTTKNQTKTAILQVSREVYAQIMNEKRVYIGCQRCRVFDEFNISQCGNCCLFNHSTKKCRNAPRCLKCSQAHLTSQCNRPEDKKCINCMAANKFLDKKRDENHCASELQKCETYTALVNKTVEKTNYPWAPVKR